MTGTIRFRCFFCQKSTIRKRSDITIHARLNLFQSWIIGTRNSTDIAKIYKVSRQTLSTWFQPFWLCIPQPKLATTAVDVLIIDGLYLESRNHAVLIGKTKTNVIHWEFVQRETYDSWILFFRHVLAPRIVVCDGQRGMRAAIRDAWPETRVQRCVFHVYQLATSRITRKPKTETGKQLLLLLRQLLTIRTRRQKRRWMRSYRSWKKRSHHFLTERTIGQQPGKKRSWWYTHRILRSVRTLIDHALPDLFTYIGHPEIPRSTNHVEGGINSRLTELLHRHRGISSKKKEVLVATFLSKKQ